MTDGVQWRGLFRDGFGLLYAGIWAWRGVVAAHVPEIPAIGVIAAIDIALMVWFLRRDLVLKRPKTVHDASLSRMTRIGRIVAIVIVVTLVRDLHRPDLLLPLIGLMIGVSYLALARALREPVHLWVGALVIGITLGALALPYHVAVAGFGTAIVVWGGCVVRLWRTEQMGAARTVLPA